MVYRGCWIPLQMTIIRVYNDDEESNVEDMDDSYFD